MTEVSGGRKVTARVIRVAGWLFGAAVALVYEMLVLTSPPPDWSHMRLRTFIGVIVMTPILIVAGAVWACGWIASRIDPDQTPPDRQESGRTERILMLAAVLGVGIVTGLAGPASAEPSFGCATAKTIREKAVCRDPRLARLDTEIAKAYAAALAHLDPATAVALRKDQRAFLDAIDTGFDYDLSFGHGDEATERDLKEALRYRNRDRSNNGKIAGLEGEMKRRLELLGAIEPGRKTPVGLWQNTTTRVSVTEQQDKLVFGFQAGNYGWSRYNCELSADLAQRGGVLEADTVSNLDISANYHNRLTLAQLGARMDLKEAGAGDKNFNGWTCPHRPELNETLFAVRSSRPLFDDGDSR